MAAEGERQKEKSGGDGILIEDSHKAQAPRQMAALHGATRDFKTGATDTSQAAVEKKQNEKAEAGLLTGGEGERSDKTSIRKLRNGKKRDMGRRLACN